VVAGLRCGVDGRISGESNLDRSGDNRSLLSANKCWGLGTTEGDSPFPLRAITLGIFGQKTSSNHGRDRLLSPPSAGETMNLPEMLPTSWQTILADEFEKPYMAQLQDFLDE